MVNEDLDSVTVMHRLLTISSHTLSKKFLRISPCLENIVDFYHNVEVHTENAEYVFHSKLPADMPEYMSIYH